MVNRILLISDVHLGAPLLNDDAEREQKLIEFLRQATDDHTVLFIVGDLFEFWFEYRHAIPNKNFATLSSLHQLSRSGIEIHYMCGNHDLWLGDFLRNEIGVHVSHRPVTRRMGRFKLFITHGDGEAQPDWRYRILKRVFTSKINIFLYRLLHPDLGIPLARKMSQVSRVQGENKPSWHHHYRKFAKSKFDAGHNVVIMGHTHRPCHEIIGECHFINLGDWIDHFTYCEVTPDAIALKSWLEKRTCIAPKFVDRTDGTQKVAEPIDIPAS